MCLKGGFGERSTGRDRLQLEPLAAWFAVSGVEGATLWQVCNTDGQ